MTIGLKPDDLGLGVNVEVVVRALEGGALLIHDDVHHEELHGVGLVLGPPKGVVLRGGAGGRDEDGVVHHADNFNLAAFLQLAEVA